MKTNRTIVSLAAMASLGLVLLSGCVADATDGSQETTRSDKADILRSPPLRPPCIPAADFPTDEVVMSVPGCGSGGVTVASLTTSGGDYLQADIVSERPASVIGACTYSYRGLVALQVKPQYPSCNGGPNYGRLSTLSVEGYVPATGQWIQLEAANTNITTGACPTFSMLVDLSNAGTGGAPIAAVRFGGSAEYYTGPGQYQIVPVTSSVVQAARFCG